MRKWKLVSKGKGKRVTMEGKWRLGQSANWACEADGSRIGGAVSRQNHNRLWKQQKTRGYSYQHFFNKTEKQDSRLRDPISSHNTQCWSSRIRRKNRVKKTLAIVKLSHTCEESDFSAPKFSRWISSQKTYVKLEVCSSWLKREPLKEKGVNGWPLHISNS